MEAEGKSSSGRTKLVKVKQGYIDWIIKLRAERPHPSTFFPALSNEDIRELYKDDPVERELALGAWCEAAAIMKSMKGKEEDILRQYYTNGYAMEEIEFGDQDAGAEN
ncbi:hypothetical protein PR202_ga02439 [Eleusine coracana subsp. coracana]|uniref:Uncharacterized protein n=1 Tax=Eleusine coracana subsp. coracana TaxID=191504 RepID=A0AAV5BLD7_ELECO|nr:hypothetical protein PR202_ga02439 [Eleusine coracana subsp. coracana]